MNRWRRQKVSERAYSLWEREGRTDGRDIDHWLQAEREVPAGLRVTFDSNAWQQVVRPDKFPKDPRNADFKKLNRALANREVGGFIVETVATLEAVKRSDRATFLSGRQSRMSVEESVASEGRIRASVRIEPDDSQHPGLHPVLEDRFREALALGFLLLKVPRIGAPAPPLAHDQSNFVPQTSPEMAERQSRTSRHFER